MIRQMTKQYLLSNNSTFYHFNGVQKIYGHTSVTWLQVLVTELFSVCLFFVVVFRFVRACVRACACEKSLVWSAMVVTL